MSFYAGKRVFITGGSKGIGRSAAELMAAQGAHVGIGARGQGAIDETVAAMRAKAKGDQRFCGVSMDVTSTESVNAGAAAAIAALGGIDVLVCNSGAAETGEVLDMDEAAFMRVMDLNYMGHVRAIRAFGPHLRQQGKGDICLVTSLVAVTGFWGYGAYGASKAAIVQMAEALRMEMKQHGVRVEVFYPPTTDTPGFAHETIAKPDVLHVVESGSAFNAAHTSEEVGQALLSSIERGRFYNLPTWDCKLQNLIVRHAPSLYHMIADDELKKGQKKVAELRARGIDPKAPKAAG
jgi:NAD(P)-dependent dehydrogenase (short-subunit alcohol dehydrogenase family)